MTATRKPLSQRQTKMLDFLRTSIEANGFPPTVRELGDAVGLSSTNSVVHQLRELETKGYISRVPGRPRMLAVLDAPAEATPITVDVLDRLLSQVAVDALVSPYWSAEDKAITLAGAEAWLSSLRDQLAASGATL